METNAARARSSRGQRVGNRVRTRAPRRTPIRKAEAFAIWECAHGRRARLAQRELVSAVVGNRARAVARARSHRVARMTRLRSARPILMGNLKHNFYWI